MAGLLFLSDCGRSLASVALWALSLKLVSLGGLLVLSTATAPWSPSYSIEDARMFASLASMAYCENVSRVLDWSCAPCQDSGTRLTSGKIRVIDADLEQSARCLVGKFDDRSGCLVTFRGTKYVENWLRTAELWMRSPSDFSHCDGCWVQEGWYDMWSNMEVQVVQALRDVGCQPGGTDGVLHLTGHSLGGGLAQLAAFSLRSRGYHTLKMYTFEAPRMGNDAFSRALSTQFADQAPCFRITHNMDPVPHLPAEAMGFVQPRPEVFYNQAGGFKVCQDREDGTCADQFWNVPEMLMQHLADHCTTPLVPSGDVCNPHGCYNDKGAASAATDAELVV